MQRMLKWPIQVLGIVVLLASCSSGADESTTITASSDTGTTETTNAGVEPASSSEGLICEDPAPVSVEPGSTVSDEIVDPPRPVDYARCFTIEAPADTGTLTFELTGLVDDLNLAVGFGSVEAVQTPGIASYWRSGESGTSDEVVTIEAPEAGIYYAVVSSGTYRNESPFTFSVRAS